MAEVVTSVKTQMFPVLSYRRWPGCPSEVPAALLYAHEKQAFKNHGQTLAMLASRGGLSPYEIMCVLDDEGLFVKHVDEENAVHRLRGVLDG